MKAFKDLLDVLERLIGEDGCVWDRKQNLSTLKEYILEEAEEVKQACDLEDGEKIKEEVGDLIYTCLFLLKVASVDTEEMLQAIKKKMIRRHPHIFGKEICNTAEDAEKIWNRIKKEEKSTP